MERKLEQQRPRLHQRTPLLLAHHALLSSLLAPRAGMVRGFETQPLRVDHCDRGHDGVSMGFEFDFNSRHDGSESLLRDCLRDCKGCDRDGDFAMVSLRSPRCNLTFFTNLDRLAFTTSFVLALIFSVRSYRNSYPVIATYKV